MAKTSLELEDIATNLAIKSKASGDHEFGNFGHYWPDLTDGEWWVVCEVAERLLPTVEASTEECAEWVKADRDFRSEIAYEQRQIGC